MIVRKIILAIGVLSALVGLTQLAFASWWLQVFPDILFSSWLPAIGVLAIIIGCVMLIAAAERLVLLRGLFVVLGIIELVVGILATVNPTMMRELAQALVLYRQPAFQVFEAWAGGAVRVILGVVIIYAVVRAPVSQRPGAEPPPTE